MEIVVRICGGFNLLLGFLHILFPKALNWAQELPNWSKENRATIHILNHCLMIFWFIFGFLYLFHPNEILTTPMGRSILVCMVLFWIVRIGILQPVYLGVKSKLSLQMLVLFTIGLALNIIPLAWGLM